MALPPDEFNEGFMGMHVQLAEGNVVEAASAWMELSALVKRGRRADGTGSATDSGDGGGRGTIAQCPHCGRRTASLQHHLRTCRQAAMARRTGAEDGGSGHDGSGRGGGRAAAAGPVEAPETTVQKEMLAALKAKIIAAARTQLKALPVAASAMEAMFALWRSMAALGDVQGASAFDDRLIAVFSAGCQDIRRDFEATRSLEQLRETGSMHGSADAVDTSQQPHVTAVTALLVYGGRVVARVLQERVPTAAKIGLAYAVHRACAEHVVHVLKAFTTDMRLELLQHKAAALSAAPPPPSSSGSGAGAGAGSGAGPGSGAGGRRLPSQEDVERIVTEISRSLDQVAYLVRICEEYLGKLALELALGSEGDATSRLGGPLAEQTQWLLATFVHLQRATTSHNVAQAIDGSEVTEMEADVPVMSMTDEVFFVLASALQRSFSTGSELAASAALNNVTRYLDEDIRAALQQQVRQCTGTGRGGFKAASSADAGAAEDALGDALTAAIMQSSHLSGPKSNRSDEAKDDEGDAVLASSTLTAMNTVSVAGQYASDLTARAEAAVEQYLPAMSRQMGMLMEELGRVAASYAAFAEEAAKSVANALVAGHMRQLSTLVRKTRFAMEFSQYESFVADNPVVDWLVHTVLKGGMVAERLRMLTPEGCDAVVRALAAIVASHLEKLVLEQTFNEVGGLALEHTVRSVTEVLSKALHDGSVREIFTRLRQCAFVLTLERLQDLYEFEFPDAPLTNVELANVARLRADFSAGVDALIYTSIPCSQTYNGKRRGAGTDWRPR